MYVISPDSAKPSLQLELQKEYEDDFLRGNLTHYDYLRRLQQWRDRYEKYLDSRPRVQPLDLLSHYLTEFQYGKFDDIEVPGQYSDVSLITRMQSSYLPFCRTRTIIKTSSRFKSLDPNSKTVDRMGIVGEDSLCTDTTIRLPHLLFNCHLEDIVDEKRGSCSCSELSMGR